MQLARTAVAMPILFSLAVAALADEDRKIPRRPEELRFEEYRFEIPSAEQYRHRLSNGVVAYVVPDHALPLVDLALAVRVGDYLDPADMIGLASLTGALIRRGGTLRLDAERFDERVDFLAGDLDSFAGATRGGVSLNCGSWVFPEMLDLLFEMLKTPRFQADRLEAVKDNILESLAQRNDDPLRILDREWRWLLFGRDHFSARQTGPSHLSSIRRQDLQEFHRRYWHPANMALAVSGDIVTADVVQQLERHFSGWRGEGESTPWPPPPSGHQPQPGLYHVEKDIPQAKIAVGHLGARRRSWEDPQSYAVLVMSEILGGGGAVSRLKSRLRAEEALVYRVGCHFGLGQYAPGDFQIFLEAESRHVAQAVELAVAEIRDLHRSPVPDAELSLAKRSLIDAFPLLFDTAEKTAGRFAEDEYLGRPHDYWQGYRRRIERVTARQVQGAAKKYLDPDRLVLLVVGRWEEIARGEAESGLRLQQLVGGGLTHLPVRDPLTLMELSSED